MAVLRIEVKVDGELREVFELNDTVAGDPVSRYWKFMELVIRNFNNWSYSYIFNR